MNVMDMYNHKLTTAEKAVNIINSGDWVDYGNFLCAPVMLDSVLAKRKHELTDVKIRAVSFPGLPAVAVSDPTRGSFVYNNWHFAGGDRILHDKGLCNFIPHLYHESSVIYEKGDVETDVFMVRTAPMDKDGFFNFGLSNSCQKVQAQRAKKVIVEVNENIPQCYF